MKATSLSEVAGVMPQLSKRVAIRDLVALAKPRISIAAALAACAGWYMATHPPYQVGELAQVFAFTFALSAGACALNQYIEREADALMERTRDRPLASGRVSPSFALFSALGLCAVSLVYGAFALNFLAAAVGALTVTVYVLVYTPLKRVTSLCTIIGAVPGALPPVIGWAAAAHSLGIGAWVIFAIMFIWQLPHFLAIAWIYREDYSRAGMPMLTVLDPQGGIVARQMALHALALLMISLMPSVLRMAGHLYFLGALLSGILYLSFITWWCIRPEWRRARLVFLASLAHLALLFILMTLDKVPA